MACFRHLGRSARAPVGVTSGVSSFWKSVRYPALQCVSSGRNPLIQLRAATRCISVRLRKTHPKSGACDGCGFCLSRPHHQVYLISPRTVPCELPSVQVELQQTGFLVCSAADPIYVSRLPTDAETLQSRNLIHLGRTEISFSNCGWCRCTF
jgi:hypothetical protein